jgi:carbonic anhydrase
MSESAGESFPDYPLQHHPPEALVIHCADPRFQDAFRGFVTRELGLKNYAPLVIGGSIHAVGSKEALPKNFDVLWDQITFFVNQAKINQVIVINHADCAWYKANAELHPEIPLEEKKKGDLSETAHRLRTEFQELRVRSFWADLDNGRVRFAEIE